jgi:adenosylcobinamide-GDP ribazoletransferase
VPQSAVPQPEPGEWHAFMQAVMFFTRVPVPRSTKWSPTILERSAMWFTTVGVLVGAFGAGVGYLSYRLFDSLVAAVLSTIATVLVTGAFHEDGLADTCDAMFASRDKSRILDIMKDSRIGTFGAAGLGLTLVLKITALNSLLAADASPWLRVGSASIGSAVLALPIVHGLSRLGSTALLRMLPYVRENDDIGSKSKPMAKEISRPRFAVAGAVAIAVAAAFVSWGHLISLLAATALTTVAMGGWFRHRIGGYTGDCLGATQQVIEVVLLLVLSAQWT